MRRNLVVFFLICFSLHGLSADEGGIITGLEVEGLRRTKLKVVEYYLERFLGTEVSEFDENAVFAAVKDSGVLEPTAAVLVVDNDTGNYILHVTVEEKWTIFLIPSASVFQSGSDFNLQLSDGNIFGIRDYAEINGGFDSNNGWFGGIYYHHKSNAKIIPGWNTSLNYNRWDREDKDKYGEEIYRKYTTSRLKANFGLDVNFTDYFSTSVSFFYLDVNNKNIEVKDDKYAVNAKTSLIGINPSVGIGRSKWDGILHSGQGAWASLTGHFAIEGSHFVSFGVGGNYEESIVPGFRYMLRSQASWTSNNDPSTTAIFEGGPGGVNIIGSYSGRNHLSLTAGLEKYIFKAKLGTMTVQGSYQCAFSDGLIDGKDFNHGPSMGLQFYLRRFAAPALGAGAAYNVSTGIWNWGFRVGGSF